MSSKSLLNAKGTQLFQSDDITNWGVTLRNGVAAGGAGNDGLLDNGVAATLSGGLGDDTYSVANRSTVVSEFANGGTDTVNSWLSHYNLPGFVENLYVGNNNAWGVGNELNNIITAGPGTQYLSGGAGDDILYGGAGSDVFIVRKGEGSDLILDFQPGAGGDRLRLDNYGVNDFASFKTLLKQVGANVVASLGGGEILTLNNVTISALTAENFLSPANMTGTHLTFGDEFDSFSMRDPATGKGTWTTHYDLAGYNALNSRTLQSNAERQVYVDPLFTGSTNQSLGLNPFVSKNGVLEIHADEVSAEMSKNLWGYQYTSGVITNKDTFSQQYGYFEVRAQVPSGQGLWPCIWLLPTSRAWPPEIDILESIGDASVAYQTSHSNDGGFNTSNGTETLVFPTNDGFHTYGLSWKADQLVWYIDGQEVKRMATPSDMHQPMYMLINLGVGGSWPGDPDPATDVHAQMNVDFVHIYSYDSNTLAPGSVADAPPTAKSVTAPAPATASTAVATAAVAPATVTPAAAKAEAPPTDISAPTATAATAGGHLSAADLDGDGKADAVWWNNAGQVSAWKSTRGQGAAASVQLGVAGHEWKAIGAANIDGDSKADLIFWNNNGQVSVWESSRGEGSAGAVNLGAIGHDWTPLGVADFNGDGKSDIAWWNTDGRVAVWQASKAAAAADTVWLGAIGHDWSVLGVSDFSGDGKADVAWRNDNGQVALWTSTAAGKMDTIMLGSIGQDSTLLSAADFNGDGRTDLAWWNKNGQVVVWQTAQGGKSVAPVTLGAIGHDWTMLGAADFNGDGVTDIAWRNANGQVAVWQMSKTAQAPQTLWLGSVGQDTRFLGAGDFNGDGKVDLAWMDGSGQLTAWQVQGDHKDVITVGQQPAGASFVPG